MDPKLAAIYGTNQETDADLEKLAAAELAEGLANDDEVDTDGLTEEELEAVAQDVLNASSEEGEEEGGNIDGEQEKTSAAEEAQEKLAEADYLGRVMAHSYHNEMQKIAAAEQEKTAGMTSGQRAAQAVKSKGGKVLGALKDIATGKQAREGFAAAKKSTSTAEAAKNMASKSIMSPKGKERAGAAIGKHMGEAAESKKKGMKGLAKTVGLYGGGAAVAGGAAAAMKKKQSSALDTLVEQRAMEILQASGIDPAELEEVDGQEKVSDPREALASAVDERAWALLGQYGVVPADTEEQE